MPIKSDLLKILACPACHGKVEHDHENETLNCVECKKMYPIRDDIPVMLVEESAMPSKA